MSKVIKQIAVLVAASAVLTGCVEDQTYVSDYYSSHSYYGDGYSSGSAPRSVSDHSYSTGSGYYSDEPPHHGRSGYVAGSAAPQSQSGYSSSQTPAQTQSGYSSSQTPSQPEDGYNSSGTASGSSGYSSSGAVSTGEAVSPAKPTQTKRATTQPASGVIPVPVLPKRTIDENEDRAAARGGSQDSGGYSSTN